jgi:hypothetical protein
MQAEVIDMAGFNSSFPISFLDASALQVENFDGTDQRTQLAATREARKFGRLRQRP